VYIAVAAVGPKARVEEAKLKSTTVSEWANSATTPVSGTLKDLWDQANEVCQQAKETAFDRDWTEQSFDNPPWKDVRDDFKNSTRHSKDKNAVHPTLPYSGADEHCLLSAPSEIR
jgi:hypothetical protein